MNKYFNNIDKEILKSNLDMVYEDSRISEVIILFSGDIQGIIDFPINENFYGPHVHKYTAKEIMQKIKSELDAEKINNNIETIQILVKVIPGTNFSKTYFKRLQRIHQLKK